MAEKDLFSIEEKTKNDDSIHKLRFLLNTLYLKKKDLKVSTQIQEPEFSLHIKLIKIRFLHCFSWQHHRHSCKEEYTLKLV